MDPLGAVSFISVQSIAGSSVPPLIINCEGGEEGRQAGLLFPLLKENCQQNNSPQLKSQYISWSLLYGGAQLLSEALSEKEPGVVQMQRNAFCTKNDYLLNNCNSLYFLIFTFSFTLFVHRNSNYIMKNWLFNI